MQTPINRHNPYHWLLTKMILLLLLSTDLWLPERMLDAGVIASWFDYSMVDWFYCSFAVLPYFSFVFLSHPPLLLSPSLPIPLYIYNPILLPPPLSLSAFLRLLCPSPSTLFFFVSLSYLLSLSPSFLFIHISPSLPPPPYFSPDSSLAPLPRP